MALRLIDDDGLREKGIRYSAAHRARLIKEGKFPKPVSRVGKSNAWVEAEIDEFIAGLIADRDRVQKEISERNQRAAAVSVAKRKATRATPSSIGIEAA